MIKSDRHIVHQVNLDITVDRAEDGQALQELAMDIFKNEVVPQLEALFAAMDRPGRNLRLEQLNIDLPDLTSIEVEQEFAAQCVRAIGKSLQQQLQLAPTQPGPAPDQQQPMDVLDANVQYRQLFLYFLKNGQLPWWAPQIDPMTDTELIGTTMRSKDWLSEANLRQEIQAAPDLWWTTLAVEAKSPRVVARLVHQYAPSFLHFLLEIGLKKKNISIPFPWSALEKQCLQIIQSNQKTTSKRDLQILFLTHSLNYFFLEAQPSIVQCVWTFFQKFHTPQHSRSIPGQPITSTIPPALKDSAKNAPLSEWVVQVWTALQQNIQEQRNSKLSTESNIIPEQHISPSESEASSAAFPQKQKDSSSEEAHSFFKHQQYPNKSEAVPYPTASNDPVYITNAGLVILHPFLQYLFKDLNLLKQKNFKDKTACQRAIYLLHYAATGSTRPAEYELYFNKLLCGWPVEEPIDARLRLNKRMKDEVDKMLGATLKHWSALKSTKIDGLRANFLLRNGKLEIKDLSWHLTVEHKPYDFLLNRLPWGIGMFKFPWHDTRFTVDWHN